MHIGDFFPIAIFGFNEPQLGLDKALEIGERLLRVHEESERLDGFTIGVFVESCEGQDKFEKAGGGG